MKILQICTARSFGGGERHVVDLSNGLARRGHEVHLALCVGSPLIPELEREFVSNCIEIRSPNALDIRNAQRLARYADQKNIDMMHAHIARDYAITAAAARIAKVPFVITRHVLFPMSLWHRLILRNVEYVIAPSNAVARNLKAEKIFPENKIVTIRNGIDINRFSGPVQKHDIPARVGTIGNLDPVKGFDVFIEAAERVASQIEGIEFVILGEDHTDDKRVRKQIDEMIEARDLQETVKIFGWSDDLNGTYAGFDIFVSASRSESFGLAIAEAMYCGVPVIATETEGGKEIISDPSLGRLVPIGSPDSLADAILDLLESAEQRKKFGQAGHSHIRDKFSVERMINETEKLYRRILQ